MDKNTHDLVDISNIDSAAASADCEDYVIGEKIPIEKS
jgi:hypothetical protein